MASLHALSTLWKKFFTYFTLEIEETGESTLFIFQSSIEGLDVGEISEPSYVKMDDGKEAYRMFIILNKIEAHTLNFKDDYQMISDLALNEKKEKTIDTWISNSLLETYIRIYDEYKSEEFKYGWIKE